YTIELVKLLKQKGVSIKLTILGDGEHFETTHAKVSSINNEFNETLIKLEGHTNDVEPYVLESHFVLGKVRSALDGVFDNRISIGDDNSFKDLLDSNLTGRNYKDITEMKMNDYQELTKLIEESKIDFSKLYDINEIAKDSYNINRVANKILKIYNDKMKKN